MNQSSSKSYPWPTWLVLLVLPIWSMGSSEIWKLPTSLRTKQKMLKFGLRRKKTFERHADIGNGRSSNDVRPW